ncbi:MAG: hypothetical protein EA402_03665, partial [Planctomycetota bacterium]
RGVWRVLDGVVLQGVIAALAQSIAHLGGAYQRLQRSRVRSSLAISVLGMVIILWVMLAGYLGWLGGGL